jgi:hypothetical protein
VAWLIPNWARAQTWGHVVLVKRGVRLTKQLLAHELAHLIGRGYKEHPLEIAARLAEQDDFYLNWAQKILNSEKKG